MYLARCIDVAERFPGPLREVAAVAVGEALLSSTPLQEELLALWQRWFASSDRTAILVRVRQAVY